MLPFLISSPRIIIGTLLIALITGGYFHYKGLLKENEILKVNERSLKDAIKHQGGAITALQNNVGSWEKAEKKRIKEMEEIKNVSEQSAKERNRLAKILAKHDIGEIAVRKPGLLEKRLNRGTADALSLFECATEGGDTCVSHRNKTTEAESSVTQSGIDKTKAVQMEDIAAGK